MHDRSLRKPLLMVVGATALLLLVPMTAMQFTTEVRWGPGDFLIAACLLLSAGVGMVLTAHYVKRRSHRIALISVLALALALVWTELAVGIFS